MQNHMRMYQSSTMRMHQDYYLRWPYRKSSQKGMLLRIGESGHTQDSKRGRVSASLASCNDEDDLQEFKVLRNPSRVDTRSPGHEITKKSFGQSSYCQGPANNTLRLLIISYRHISTQNFCHIIDHPGSPFTAHIQIQYCTIRRQ